MYDSIDRQSELSSSPVCQPDGFDDLRHHSCRILLESSPSWAQLIAVAGSGRYFSFPSFDIYEADQQDQHKETELKSP